jgi:hypothetical protein
MEVSPLELFGAQQHHKEIDNQGNGHAADNQVFHVLPSRPRKPT